MTQHSGDEAFQEELRSLLASGQKIEAIKRYRGRTGVGLKEAKDAVEALERGAPLPAFEQPASGSVEWDVVTLLEQGRKIDAIKVYRERTGAGLKDAKDAVERMAAERGIVSPSGVGCFGVVMLTIGMIAYSSALVRHVLTLGLMSVP